MARILNTIVSRGKRLVCRIYDNEGRSFDRYTICFKARRIDHKLYWPYLGSSENPYHPQGFGQHGESDRPIGREELGKRVSFESIPDQVKRFIEDNI